MNKIQVSNQSWHWKLIRRELWVSGYNDLDSCTYITLLLRSLLSIFAKALGIMVASIFLIPFFAYLLFCAVIFLPEVISFYLFDFSILWWIWDIHSITHPLVHPLMMFFLGIVLNCALVLILWIEGGISKIARLLKKISISKFLPSSLKTTVNQTEQVVDLFKVRFKDKVCIPIEIVSD